MAEEYDLTEYYNKIRERGWGCWVHGVKQAFIPIVHPGWQKKTQKISEDRQVTISWDPMRFTDKLADQNVGVDVFRNAKHKVMLFPVLVA